MGAAIRPCVSIAGHKGFAIGAPIAVGFRLREPFRGIPDRIEAEPACNARALHRLRPIQQVNRRAPHDHQPPRPPTGVLCLAMIRGHTNADDTLASASRRGGSVFRADRVSISSGPARKRSRKHPWPALTVAGKLFANCTRSRLRNGRFPARLRQSRQALDDDIPSSGWGQAGGGSVRGRSVPHSDGSVLMRVEAMTIPAQIARALFDAA